MAPISFSLTALLARFIKAVMVVVIAPFAVGLLQAILEQLEVVSLSGGTSREWVQVGFMTYVGLHVLLYRPVGLFRASHRMFSTLAVWLFGGQVASVEESGSGKAKSARGSSNGSATQGSTLVAFSPYVVPLYTVLVCALAGISGRWMNRALADGPLTFFIGVTMAFHWLMTADNLQQQRKRWHVETYLLALGLVFVFTLLVAAACLPWAVPDVSFIHTLAESLSNTEAIYTAIFRRLFF